MFFGTSKVQLCNRTTPRLRIFSSVESANLKLFDQGKKKLVFVVAQLDGTHVELFSVGVNDKTANTK